MGSRRLAQAALGTLLGVLLADPPAAQDATDWNDAVHKAAEHPRFAVRRAAAGRVAQGGDAAVPAIRAFEASAGRVRIPLELVDAIAGSDRGGDAMAGLLQDWATDREFYWRAQALGGLARRGLADRLPLFRAATSDPSHLVRIEGARGLLTAGTDDADRRRAAALLTDEDPRTRLRIALLLLARGDARGAGEIVAAARRVDRVFVDDPWGAREAVYALRELRAQTGDDLTAAAGPPGADREAALDALVAWARAALPGWEDPGPESAPPTAAGGVEVRSCRNGDLFLRWTADGTAVLGLAPFRTVPLDAARFAALRDRLPTIAGVEIHGTVVCDYLRLFVPPTAEGDAPVHHKAAPSALPAPLLDWLKTLAATLDETGSGAPLESRLGQFAPGERND